MKQKGLIISIIITVFLLVTTATADYLHTVDKKIYEGKMVAFKFNTIYFNVYKFGKIYKTIRFPLYKVWKVEFNEPKKDGLESSFEIEQDYNELRKGKRSKDIMILAVDQWNDTGIDLKTGQDVLFFASGSIFVDPQTLVYQNGETSVNWNNKKPLPNQPTGAVIGKIGKNGTPFYIGDDKAPFQVGEPGRLFIGINDFDFSDNSGKFNIKVFY